MLNLTVVVPCYNSAETIAETLDSIFEQTLPPQEVIVVDDGSTDETTKIVEKYKGRTRLVRQSNNGVSSARNRGAQCARSDWIAFCDSDDAWSPKKLEVVARCIDSFPDTSLIFHDFSILYEGRLLAKRATESKHSLFPLFRRHRVSMSQILPNHRYIGVGADAPNERLDVYRGNAVYWMLAGNFIAPSTFVIKRDLFASSMGFDETYVSAEDTEFFLRLSRENDFTYIDKPLATYRVWQGSLVHREIEQTLVNGVRALSGFFDASEEIPRELRDRYRSSLAERLAHLSYYYLSELRAEDARSAARKALSYRRSEKLAWMVLAASLAPRAALDWARKLKTKSRVRRPKEVSEEALREGM